MISNSVGDTKIVATLGGQPDVFDPLKEYHY